jgi:hypothetical protein
MGVLKSILWKRKTLLHDTYIYIRDGQPAAQKEISAAQNSNLESAIFRFFGCISSRCYYAAQKVYIFGKFFKLRPTDQFGLATPDLYIPIILSTFYKSWLSE